MFTCTEHPAGITAAVTYPRAPFRDVKKVPLICSAAIIYFFCHASTADKCVPLLFFLSSTYCTHAQTRDNVRVQSATIDCFGTYFTHAQTCDNVRVPSATQWTASVRTLRMHKPVITFVFKVLRNGLTHAQTCDNVRVQSATQWTASVHTLHMHKPVITFVFKVLRNGLLPYILYTCPNLW